MCIERFNRSACNLSPHDSRILLAWSFTVALKLSYTEIMNTHVVKFRLKIPDVLWAKTNQKPSTVFYQEFCDIEVGYMEV